MKDIFAKINQLLAIYCLLLIIFGTIGNLFSFFICMRKNLRKIPTFVFLSYMLLTETITLYLWNLNHFTSTYFGYVIDGIDINLCKFFFFTQLTSLQVSAWLLVSLIYKQTRINKLNF